MNDSDKAACADGMCAIVQWAASVTPSDIPRPVLERAARVLADDLAVMIGARDEPELRRFHDRVLARAGAQQATVFRGGRRQTDKFSAAIANATAADWLELDEGYRGTPCHAGLYVLPALLAEGEARNKSFSDLLRCLVVGYEVVTRIARAFTPEVFALQAHARYAAVGASAATALAARAGAPVMLDALNSAVTLINLGPRSQLMSGALSRNVWAAAGAWSGMMSVEWAECGIGGPKDSFFDVYETVLGARLRPEALTQDLGRTWAVMDGYTKIYACCQHLHSAVEAALELRQPLLESGFAEVAEITVETHPLAMPFASKAPSTTLGAKFSMPHAVAAALATGSGGADAFTGSMLTDPVVSHLRERVTLSGYSPAKPPPHDRPARLRVRLRDGTSLERECLSAEGGSDRPFKASVLLEKISTLTAPVYPRFLPVFGALMQLDSARMNQSWSDIVGDFCKPD